MPNVFIVDDSALTRASVQKTLQSAGFDVIACISGEDCLSKVRSFKETIHLFIVDLNMPGMDGISLIENLRSLKRTKYTPILMLTTESSPQQKMRGKKAGASGWFVKPFKPERLISIAKRFADNTSRADSSNAHTKNKK